MPTSDAPPAAPDIPARIVRLLLIAAVLWLGWQTLTSFRELLSDSPPVGHVDTDTTALPELPPPPAMQLLDGAWVFGDQAWRLEVGPVSVEQLPQRLTRLPPSSAPPGAVSDLEQRILKLGQVLAKPESLDESRRRYVARLGEARGVVFTTGDGPNERVLLARLAFRGQEARWQLLELSPRAAGQTAAPLAGNHLLPLAERAKLLGQRREDSGRVMCELISVAETPDELRKFWQGRGWTVETYPDQPADEGPWYCQRGGDAVHVWLRRDGQQDGRRLLILVRMPTETLDAAAKRR
jgi:hypothetical protein